MTLFTRSPRSTALIGDAHLCGHFLESDGIVNGNSRRSDTNPENDQSFPELGLSSVREFPGSIQCIPDIWLSFHGAPAFRLRLQQRPKLSNIPHAIEAEYFLDEFRARVGAKHRRHQIAGFCHNLFLAHGVLRSAAHGVVMFL